MPSDEQPRLPDPAYRPAPGPQPGAGAPTMALIILGGSRGAVADASPAAMPQVVRDKLLETLPSAPRVVHIGCGDAALRTRYLARHPGSTWRDAAPTELAGLHERFDLLLVGDALQARVDSAALLDTLHALCAPEGRLFAWVRNAVQPELFERLAESDLSGEGDGAAHRHSASSAFKLLMDGGWMPTLAGECTVEAANPASLAAAAQLAAALGVPQTTALSRLSRDFLIIDSRPSFHAAVAAYGDGSAARFTVVVPTTRDTQMRLNVERSPGLREVAAPVVSYRQARHPAEALEQSLPHCERDWVLFCHQDVYFPSGFGLQLNSLLASVPTDERARTLIGFAGMGVNRATESCEPAGFVIDRTGRFDHAANDAAISIDELAIVVARDSLHRIDPAIGWHLWATELCLAAIYEHRQFARIVRLPLFHNSNNNYVLPPAFHTSATYLAKKYAGHGVIQTLCGNIAAPALAA